MAQLFPMTAGEIVGDDDGRPSLAATLVALPDPWTVLCNRPIGDGDGTELVEIVLVHPEIGVALIDEAPRDPTSAIAVLRAYLDDQRFAEFFPGELPLVALSVASDELWEIGDRLAAAFEAAPLLSIADRDWADAVIELLLLPDELGAQAAEPASETLAEEPLPEELGTAVAEPARGALEEEPLPEAALASPVERPLEGREPTLPHLAAPLDLERASLRVDFPFIEDEAPPRRWRGLTAAAAVTVILSAGVGLAAWRLGQEEPNPPPASASVAAPPLIEVPAPQRPAEATMAAPPAIPGPRPATPAPPPVPPARPVVLAAKPLAPPPPPPPVPTPIEPLPQVAAATPAAAATPHAASAGVPPAARPPDSAAAASHASPATAQPNRRVAAQQRAPAAPPPPRQEAHVTASRPHPAERAPGPPIDAADLPPLEPAAPAPPIALTATPVPNVRECRPYTSETTLAGRGLPVQGIACRDPEGAWRLMTEVPLR